MMRSEFIQQRVPPRFRLVYGIVSPEHDSSFVHMSGYHLLSTLELSPGSAEAGSYKRAEAGINMVNTNPYAQVDLTFAVTAAVE